jgi:alpha-glucoside transport system permease protein
VQLPAASQTMQSFGWSEISSSRTSLRSSSSFGVAVWTTIVIFTLKIFDVVWVMTGGQFGTHVIATQFYRQSFTNRNSGFGSAIAIVLLLAVVPVMIYNLQQFRKREAF